MKTLFLAKILFLAFSRETLQKPLSLLLPPLFLLITSFTFALALRNIPDSLPHILPAVLIVSSLLAILLSADDLFNPLISSHTLTLLILQPSSLSLAITMRIISHWTLRILPTIILTPLIALFFLSDISESPLLIPALIANSLSITLLTAFISALTIGLPSFAFLATLLILPLSTPLLIFTLLAASPTPSAFPAFLSLLASAPLLLLLNSLFSPSLLRISLS